MVRKGFCASSVEHMLQVSAGRAFLGLDRVCYIPGTGPRPRYEEQVAQTARRCTVAELCGKQGALCSLWMELGGQSIGGNYWKPPISCSMKSRRLCNRVDLSSNLIPAIH